MRRCVLFALNCLPSTNTRIQGEGEEAHRAGGDSAPPPLFRAGIVHRDGLFKVMALQRATKKACKQS